MRALRRVGIVTLLLLGGCGQRGALYLPEPERDVVVTPQASPIPQASPVPPATPAADAPAASPAPATPDPNDPLRRNNGTQRN